VSLKYLASTASDPAAFRRTWQVGDMLDLVAGLIAVGLIVLVYAGWSGPLRILLALAFTFFVPGRAIVTNWHRIARWSEMAMSMVFSLALLTLVTTIALWTHNWHPLGLFQVMAWLSLVTLGVGVVRRPRMRPDTGARPAGPW
jgi:uncharacterized membrane protein